MYLGSYSLVGATTCIQCSAGNSAVTGSAGCSQCEAGYFAPTGSSTCLKCEAGTVSLTGSANCAPCLEKDTFANADSTNCVSVSLAPTPVPEPVTVLSFWVELTVEGLSNCDEVSESIQIAFVVAVATSAGVSVEFVIYESCADTLSIARNLVQKVASLRGSSRLLPVQPLLYRRLQQSTSSTETSSAIKLRFSITVPVFSTDDSTVVNETVLSLAVQDQIVTDIKTAVQRGTFSEAMQTEYERQVILYEGDEHSSI